MDKGGRGGQSGQGGAEGSARRGGQSGAGGGGGREPLLLPHGGYQKLKSFQVAQLAFDLTVLFCDRYIDRRSRTHDQMVQAARSGVQNIAEGSVASGTSKKIELKLTNIARASLEELRLDYEDYLRQRHLPRWERHDPRRDALVARRPADLAEVAEWARDAFQQSRASQRPPQSTSSTPSTYPEIVANAALTLLDVATALLDRQLAALAATFEAEGGFTERMYRVRQNRRRGA